MSTKEGPRVTEKVLETQTGGKMILLRGLLGEDDQGRNIFVEFSPDSPLGRVFVEGDEDCATRIDFGKQVCLDGIVAGWQAERVVDEVAKMFQEWERQKVLREVSVDELIEALIAKLRP